MLPSFSEGPAGIAKEAAQSTAPTVKKTRAITGLFTIMGPDRRLDPCRDFRRTGGRQLPGYVT